MHHVWRYIPFAAVVELGIACWAAGAAATPLFYWPLVVLVPLTALGVFDVAQASHAILRNYPIIGHLRYLIEEIRPSIRQYLIEDDRDPVPFSREQRNVAYRRSKDIHSTAIPSGRSSTSTSPGMAGSAIRSARTRSRIAIFAWRSAGRTAGGPTRHRSSTFPA